MSNEPDTESEAKSKQERAESVRRQLEGEDPPQDTTQPVGPTGGEEGESAPEGVGESVARRGEDVVTTEGKEPGREDTGTDDTPAERPTGTSTTRDATAVEPEDPTTDSPPQGGPGGPGA